MKNSYRLLVFALCLGLVSAVNASNPTTWTWAFKAVGMAGTGFYDNSATGVSIDDQGNSLVIGSFNDSVTFNGTKVKAQTHGLDAFVAKFNSAGTFQWVRTIGSPYDQDAGIDIATDPSGNSYITSFFHDSAIVGANVIQQGTFSSVVVAKYNSSGTPQWARLATGLSVATIGGIAYSPDGSVYVGNSVSLGKYDASNGDSLWTLTTAIDSGQILIRDVTTDKTGDNVFMTGILLGTVYLDGHRLSSGDQSNWDIFLVKTNKDGHVVWAKHAGDSVNSLYDMGNSVTVDQSGNVYLGGQFSGTAHFDSDSVSAGSSFWAMFVAKYNSAGVCQWVKAGNGPSNINFATTSDVRLVGNETGVLVAAYFNAQLNFGASQFFVTGGDAIILKLTASNGALEWGKQSGSTFALITASAMDVNRNTSALTLVGHFNSFAATFTPLTLTAPTGGVGDLFVVGGSTDAPTPVKERPSDVLPSAFILNQNYPNPFNPTTTISYSLPNRAQVQVVVYNVLGEQVRMLVNEEQHAGSYSVEWDGRDNGGTKAASGVYFYRIQAGEFSETKKMVLVK